ncbi:hypothetical protein SDC9_194911 [bioreactor metagenome]|uniref:Uncharacterized protein n=1 Tax=bioreactor metagenome TaxID=1076179 RepID=A0A645IA52_9ZZZZ
MPLSRVLNDFLDIFLCIVPPMWNVILHFPSVATLGATTPGNPFGQFRIFFYFDTPTTIFRQVPVEHIQLELCHPVDEFLDIFLRIKISAYIQHQTPISKTGRITDGDTGYRQSTILLGEKLVQRLYSIKDTCRIARNCNS